MKIQILFVGGGGLNFLILIVYLITKTRAKDQLELELLKANSQNGEEIIKQKRIVNYISRFITYSLIFFAIYYLLGWKSFLWVGIVFGLFYIPEAIVFVSKRKNL